MNIMEENFEIKSCIEILTNDIKIYAIISTIWTCFSRRLFLHLWDMPGRRC